MSVINKDQPKEGIKERINLIKRQISSIVPSAILLKKDIYTFFAIIPYKSKSEFDSFIVILEQILDSGNEWICGVSKSKNGIYDLPNGWNESSQALRYHSASAREGIIFYKNIETLFSSEYPEVEDLTNELIRKLNNPETRKDTMAMYEDIALSFYNDSNVINALLENENLSNNNAKDRNDIFEKNAFTIENKLYNIGANKKHIVNAQFVTPNKQYHMVESKGYRRGGTIGDLDAFYESEFYQLPCQKQGYPVWIDGPEQTKTFYKTEQSVYGFANIVTLGVAVYTPASREFLGVLILNIDLASFSNAMRGYESYNNGNTFLVGRDGVLNWFNPSIKAPSFPKDQVLIPTKIQEQNNIIRTNLNDRPVLLAYEKLDNSQIYVTHIADLSVLLGRTYQIRNLCIILLICIVIACFIASYYVTISISDPIEQLVEVMEETGDGTWTARYDNSGNDEVTILGNHFNEMADKTNQLIDQVYISEINRQKTLVSWKNAQLNAMLMQINPHFLYNTLDIIRWEAMYAANGESSVTKMIEKFSYLCRMSTNIASNTITLQESIEHATIYMDIINFRHQDKIKFTVNNELNANDLYVPQFILQPIIENAVIHGFDNASKGRNITIDTFCKNDTLYIIVGDNGKGMSDKEINNLRTSLKKGDTTESVGLINVHQRIQLFYGNDYEVKVLSTSSQGTKIQISLPIRYHSEDMQS